MPISTISEGKKSLYNNNLKSRWWWSGVVVRQLLMNRRVRSTWTLISQGPSKVLLYLPQQLVDSFTQANARKEWMRGGRIKEKRLPLGSSVIKTEFCENISSGVIHGAAFLQCSCFWLCLRNFYRFGMNTASTSPALLLQVISSCSSKWESTLSFSYPKFLWQ